MLTDDRIFLRSWIAANGVAEAVGLGTTFVLGTAAAPLLEADRDVMGVVGVAILTVLLGTFLEGVVVGIAQGAVLGARRPDVRRDAWVMATSLGAGLAWLIGMIPSTVMSLSAPPTWQSPIQEPALLIQLLLAAGLGLVTGPILGGAQWAVLRRHLPRSAPWLWANALAWAFGMPVIFAGMNLVPWTGTAVARVAAIYSVCLAAGLIVGAVHGVVLTRMTRTAARTAAT